MPIAAHVPVPYDKEDRDATQLFTPFLGHDTRTSTGHPLRHAALNTIRSVADFRASSSSSTAPSPSPPPPEPSASASSPRSFGAPTPAAGEAPASRNGAHYLLTSLALFTTHEPCIMCSMALLHSRVKEVFYLVPMAKTGGCGSVACLPALKGVNHRYNIGRWKDCESGIGWSEGEGIRVDDDMDA